MACGSRARLATGPPSGRVKRPKMPTATGGRVLSTRIKRPPHGGLWYRAYMATALQILGATTATDGGPLAKSKVFRPVTLSLAPPFGRR